MQQDALLERWFAARRVGVGIRYPLGVAVLAALYYASARIGIDLNFAGPVAAIVWPPVGVGIAFLYLRGVAFWPGVLIGDLLVNDYSAVARGAAVGQSWGSGLEGGVATVLSRGLGPGGR